VAQAQFNQVSQSTGGRLATRAGAKGGTDSNESSNCFHGRWLRDLDRVIGAWRR